MHWGGGAVTFMAIKSGVDFQAAYKPKVFGQVYGYESNKENETSQCLDLE